jgi:hypothetical protein
MKIKIIAAGGKGYRRRGNRCRFTFEISNFGELSSRDGEPYTKTYCWATYTWSGEDWDTLGFETHPLYPPPRRPYPGELISALAGSEIEARALRAMGVTWAS